MRAIRAELSESHSLRSISIVSVCVSRERKTLTEFSLLLAKVLFIISVNFFVLTFIFIFPLKILNVTWMCCGFFILSIYFIHFHVWQIMFWHTNDIFECNAIKNVWSWFTSFGLSHICPWRKRFSKSGLLPAGLAVILVVIIDLFRTSRYWHV